MKRLLLLASLLISFNVFGAVNSPGYASDDSTSLSGGVTPIKPRLSLANSPVSLWNVNANKCLAKTFTWTDLGATCSGMAASTLSGDYYKITATSGIGDATVKCVYPDWAVLDPTASFCEPPLTHIAQLLGGSGTPVDFGVNDLGGGSAVRTITITNTGTGEIGPFVFSGLPSGVTFAGQTCQGLPAITATQPMGGTCIATFSLSFSAVTSFNSTITATSPGVAGFSFVMGGSVVSPPPPPSTITSAGCDRGSISIRGFPSMNCYYSFSVAYSPFPSPLPNTPSGYIRYT